MGCDIHVYLEYTDSEQDDADTWITNDGYISSSGRFSIRRDYTLFAIMAGVRDYDGLKLFEPKGRPRKLGMYAAGDAHLFVSEHVVGDGFCTPQDADRWIAEGCSEWVTKGAQITHPDHHSYSWLTTREFEAVLAKYREASTRKRPGPDAVALLAAMKAFESEGHAARIVFWFDN